MIKRMIDLRLTANVDDFEAVLYLNELTLWVLNEARRIMREKPVCTGLVIIFIKESGRDGCLLMCEGETQTVIQALLQEPPEKLGKRYNSFIVHDEPKCVTEVEKKKDSWDEDDEGTLFVKKST